jgi:hypothetical protein
VTDSISAPFELKIRLLYIHTRASCRGSMPGTHTGDPYQEAVSGIRSYAGTESARQSNNLKRQVISLGAIEIELAAPAKAGVQKPLLMRDPLDSGLRRKDAL